MTAAIGASLRATTIDKGAPHPGRSGMVTNLSIRVIAAFLFGIALGCNAISQAQRSSPDSNAQLGQIEILIRQSHLDEAKARTMDELRRNPSSVEAYNLLGMIQGEQQDFAASAVSFQNALKLKPGSTRTHNNLGSLYV